MSNVVEFPDLAPAEGYSEAYIENLHAEAFRDLEGGVAILSAWARLPKILSCNVSPERTAIASWSCPPLLSYNWRRCCGTSKAGTSSAGTVS
jgi:hypothetical protein